jgi:co-chaperonin GroES (HSP10)
MLPESDRVGSILLPDSVSGKFRPDVGIVLASGPDVSLERGALIAVRPYDGQWLEEFEAGGYRTRNQVRIFGKCTVHQGTTERVPWDESVVCRIFPETVEMQAVGHNLLIKRDPQVKNQSGLILPDLEHYHTGLATILSIGPDADLVTRNGRAGVGDRIHYDVRSTLDFAFTDDPDLAIIPDVGVNFVIAGEAAA